MTVEELKGNPFEGSVNVSQLLKEPVGSTRNYQVEEILDEPAREPVSGKLTFIHTRQGVLIQGELAAELELTCSRCLNTFSRTVSFNIEEEFLPTSPSSLPVSVTIDNNHILDLGEIIRQHILLNLPMKPLCQPNCPGIKEVSSHGFA
jgi:uncharacterized protein